MDLQEEVQSFRYSPGQQAQSRTSKVLRSSLQGDPKEDSVSILPPSSPRSLLPEQHKEFADELPNECFLWA